MTRAFRRTIGRRRWTRTVNTIALTVLCTLRFSAQSSTPAAAPAAQQAPPRQQFDTKAELVLVDVTVLDGDSQPITDLKPEEFDLQVNGDPRAIASVQYISTAPTVTAPEKALEKQYSANDAPTSGRLLLFVVDESNIRPGSANGVLRTAEMLLGQLSPGDLVGLSRMPTGAGSVEFTTDRDRIRAGLQRMTGTSAGPISNSNIRIGEAYALETNDTDTWQQAVDRECGTQTDMARESCADALEADARTLTTDARARAVATVRYLEALFARLATLRTPVNLVMISEGLFLGRDSQSMATLARRAAEARATLHIVRPNTAMMADVSSNVPGMRGAYFDDGLMREGLDQLAGQTRGRVLQVSAGTGAGVFERLGRELSGYYLLGFEPTADDRGGKDRRIRVQVRRKGLSVRARPTFAMRTAEADTAATAMKSPEKTVNELLNAPLPERGLPLRVATYNTRDPKDPRTRVVVAAEVGENVKTSGEVRVGVLVLDKDDKVAAAENASLTLDPARERGASPRLLQTSVLLEPGEYTLRVAAVDADGRSGSVHHSIDARLHKVAGRREAADLLIAPQPSATKSARVPASGVIDTEGLSVSIDVTGLDEPLLNSTRVAVQVADSPTGATLVGGDLAVQSRVGLVRSFGGTIRLGLLPPGDYVVRALVGGGTKDAETRVVRAFRFQPVTGPEATASTAPPPPVDTPEPSPDDVAVPPPPPRISVRLPTFDAASVLKPEIVGAFLDSLEELHPPSAAVIPVIAKARTGTFNAPDVGKNVPPDDEVALAFVHGLGELQKKKYASATAWFQVALRAADDFLGAAFYLGAGHAADGRDGDAIGAWTMSLVSEHADYVYPVLVDALLRAGDGLQALTFIDEAPDAWSDDDVRDERQAIAEAMTGAYAPALERLSGLLEKRASDTNLLYLALQVMYRIRQESGPLNAENRARFLDYAARYAKADGPQAALVESWRKFIEKR